MRLELAEQVRGEAPRSRRVVTTVDLFLGGARREQQRHLLNEPDIARNGHGLVIELNEAGAPGAVQRREWEDVLLPALANSAEPRPAVLPFEERANRRLFAFRCVLVAGTFFPKV